MHSISSANHGAILDPRVSLTQLSVLDLRKLANKLWAME
jgi:hypothetical protein